MSRTLFLALSILGMDFLLYILFQWTYGDRRRTIARKVKTYRNARPLPISSKPQNLRGTEAARDAGYAQREKGYMAQPMPRPISTNSANDQRMYLKRSGGRRLRNPKATEITKAKSSMA
jgi:hypothetical protein